MLRFIIALVICIFVAQGVIADDVVVPFVIETHLVSVSGTNAPVSVTFKLNTSTGGVWQLDGKTFRKVPLVGDWNYALNKPSKKEAEADRKWQAVIDKMDSIIIPEIDFRQANIRDVVDFLHKASVECDTDNNADNVGISFMLKLPNYSAATNYTASPDPWGEIDDSADNSNSGEILVTFSALGMTLGEALEVVVEYANLKYIIRDGIVKIMPKLGCDLGGLEHRMYNVIPEVARRIEDLQYIQADLWGTNTPPPTIQEIWMLSFTEFGVSWPSASSIKYVKWLGKIVACNTLENFKIFEKALRVINVHPPRMGRFSLITLRSETPPVLVLFDADSGHTWRYKIDIFNAAEGKIESGRFVGIQEAEHKKK